MACGTDAGVKESFISVDVADSVEQGLIEKRGFDRRFSITEKGNEVVKRDRERFGAGAFVFCIGCYDGEAAKAAGIDKSEFFTAAERKDSVGVRRNRGVWSGDEETAGHAEVNEELGRLFLPA